MPTVEPEPTVKEVTIETSIKEGIVIEKDTVIDIENKEEIVIGSSTTKGPGITVKEGATLVINMKGDKDIAIVGGYDDESVYDMRIAYPAIEVSKTATVVINNETGNVINLKAGSRVGVPVTGAGIGTAGLSSNVRAVESEDTGYIILNGSGKIRIYVQQTLEDGTKQAQGAAIGSGGVATNNLYSVALSGKVDEKKIAISKDVKLEFVREDGIKIGPGKINQAGVVKDRNAALR